MCLSLRTPQISLDINDIEIKQEKFTKQLSIDDYYKSEFFNQFVNTFAFFKLKQ